MKGGKGCSQHFLYDETHAGKEDGSNLKSGKYHGPN